MSQCSNYVAVCCSGSESQGGLFWRAVRPQSSLTLLIPFYSCWRSWQLSQLYLTLNDLLEKKEHASGAKRPAECFSCSTSSIPWYFMQFAVWTRDCSHHMSHTTNAQRCKVQMYTHVDRLWMVTTCNDTTLSEYLDRGPLIDSTMCLLNGESWRPVQVTELRAGQPPDCCWPFVQNVRTSPASAGAPTNFVDGDLQ